MNFKPLHIQKKIFLQWHYVGIDLEIVALIKTLNRKKYYTISSCQGHSKALFFHIWFKNPPITHTLPEGFYWDLQSFTLRSKSIKPFIPPLINWAQSLPPIT